MTAVASTSSPSNQRPLLLQPLFVFQVACLFIVSYLADVESKRILQQHPSLSFTLTTAQFLMSSLCGYVLIRILHGRIQRLPPTWTACFPLLPMTLSQTFGTLATTLSIRAMSVGFVHTVKAAEPLFTAAIARIIMKERFTLALYLSLLPIITGVILTSLTEMSFTWIGLTFALISNACFASRAVLIGKQGAVQKARVEELNAKRAQATVAWDAYKSSKDKSIAKPVDPSSIALDPSQLHLDDTNNFFYICTFSALLILPIAVALEGDYFIAVISTELSKGEYNLLLRLILQGIGQYSYTLCSMLILGQTSPITHVVMHALRRVYVIFLSIYMKDGHFQNVTAQNIIGTTMVLAGAMWFAREKGKQKKAIASNATQKESKKTQ